VVNDPLASPLIISFAFMECCMLMWLLVGIAIDLI
jgi:hypothetical protein